jgi:hypothetical protein
MARLSVQYRLLRDEETLALCVVCQQHLKRVEPEQFLEIPGISTLKAELRYPQIDPSTCIETCYGHVLHATCFERWARNSNACPTCRTTAEGPPTVVEHRITRLRRLADEGDFETLLELQTLLATPRLRDRLTLAIAPIVAFLRNDKFDLVIQTAYLLLEQEMDILSRTELIRLVAHAQYGKAKVQERQGSIFGPQGFDETTPRLMRQSLSCFLLAYRLDPYQDHFVDQMGGGSDIVYWDLNIQHEFEGRNIGTTDLPQRTQISYYTYF